MTIAKQLTGAIGALAACAAGVLGAPAAASAATLSLDGSIPQLIDTAGVGDRLYAGVNDDYVSEGEWVFYTDVADPSVTVGAGCLANGGNPVCSFGAAPPATAKVDLGGGDDALTFSVMGGATTSATLLGGPGDDEIRAYQVRGVIDGGAGDDVMRPDDQVSALRLPPAPSPGTVIRGGPGDDTVYYANALDAIDVSLDGKANDGRKGERDNVMPDVESIDGANFGGTLIGSDGDNLITGGNGADRIAGGGGRDDLGSGSGNDTIDALDGAGGDRVGCGDGTDIAYVDPGDVVTDDCEKVVYAATVASAKLPYGAGHVAVSLRCPTASSATCAGSVRLATVKGKRIAAASYRIRRGKAATVPLSAPKRPARKAVLTVAPKGSNPIAGRAVTVR